MTCSNCGNENASGAVCKVCGSPLVERLSEEEHQEKLREKEALVNKPLIQTEEDNTSNEEKIEELSEEKTVEEKNVEEKSEEKEEAAPVNTNDNNTTVPNSIENVDNKQTSVIVTPPAPVTLNTQQAPATNALELNSTLGEIPSIKYADGDVVYPEGLQNLAIPGNFKFTDERDKTDDEEVIPKVIDKETVEQTPTPIKPKVPLRKNVTRIRKKRKKAIIKILIAIAIFLILYIILAFVILPEILY